MTTKKRGARRAKKAVKTRRKNCKQQKDFFGSTKKPFDVSDIRDKKDRF